MSYVIPLKTEFVKNGFKYTQIKRTRYLAIYHQQLIRGKAQYWEVWVIRIREATTIRDIMLSRRERMPSDEEWGTFAWTFFTRAGAEFRFNELLTHQKYALGKDGPFSDEGHPHSTPCHPPEPGTVEPKKDKFP